MAFGETSTADAAMAIIRLAKKVEALEAEIKRLNDVNRRQDLQRVVDNANRPKEGPKGEKGDSIKGEPGPMGPMPDHRWRGTSLSFQLPEGGWGHSVDLQGPPGQGGGIIGGAGSQIPSGGLSGQVLAKASDANRDLEWINQSGGAGGGDMSAATYDAAGKEAQILTVEDLASVNDAKMDYLFPAADPQIEQAVNALGAKINEIIAALT